MIKEDYSSVVVLKPWGAEYLCYSNDTVAIWLLHIKNKSSTSMHCHPNKNTGLIVLDGSIELSFLTNKIILNKLKKISIFKSRFHSSKAISKEGAILLEIETPVDKKDLVRLYDNYGRENKGYEGKEVFQAKGKNDLIIPSAKIDPIVIEMHGSNIKHILIQNDNFLNIIDDDNIIVFTKGGYFDGSEKENKQILRPADVLDGKSMKLLGSKFNLLKDTSALVIEKIK